MRPKIALKKIARLLKLPSFEAKEAAALGVSSATLAYYVTTRELERVGRGIYRAVDAPTIEDFRWEDLVAKVQKIKGGVICLISALAFYELTEEIPRQYWIAVRNSTRHRADSSTKIVRMRNLELGRTQARIGKIAIPIFDRERTIVDSFRYLGEETAIKALKMAVAQQGARKINLDKLRKYAEAMRVKIEPYILTVTT